MTLADIQVVLDISHHQDLSLNLAQCKRDGVAAVLLKAGEGNTFVDNEFAANLAEARAAGLLAGAYWYVRSGATAAQHVAAIQRVVPAGMVVIPDVESGSGGVALVREIVRLLLAAGYRVPWTYLPRWYWQQIGSPSLVGLPPLWSSRYPDNVVGTLASEWAAVPASYWNGYGGLSVGLLQFTSSARIAGYQPLDASAFRGTYIQLAAQFGGSSPATRKRLQAMIVVTCVEPNHAGILEGGRLFDITDDPTAREFAQAAIGAGTAAELRVAAATWDEFAAATPAPPAEGLRLVPEGSITFHNA